MLMLPLYVEECSYVCGGSANVTMCDGGTNVTCVCGEGAHAAHCAHAAGVAMPLVSVHSADLAPPSPDSAGTAALCHVTPSKHITIYTDIHTATDLCHF